MLKIICAHPGTGRRDLFHALRNRRDVVVYYTDPSNVDLSMFNWEEIATSLTQHVFILPTHESVLNGLEELGLVYDLVYPDQDVPLNQLQVAMAVEGMSLQQILDVTQYWHRKIQLLQGRRSNLCNHIVLDSSKCLINTHGKYRNEPKSN